jgi:hypothetical protein
MSALPEWFVELNIILRSAMYSPKRENIDWSERERET